MKCLPERGGLTEVLACEGTRVSGGGVSCCEQACSVVDGSSDAPSERKYWRVSLTSGTSSLPCQMTCAKYEVSVPGPEAGGNGRDVG